jgi:hypothetical protein
MAEKKQPYDNIIDAILDRREPDWKDLDLAEAHESGKEQLGRTHQYADEEFLDEIAESASHHTPVPPTGKSAGIYEERISEKEAAAPRLAGVSADWHKDAYSRMDEYKSEVGDDASLMDEVTESLESAYGGSNLAENSAEKKAITDAEVQKYVRDLLNQGASPAKVAAQLQKLAEIELFNHQSATDYLQRNAGLLGLAYLEPNTYMDKNSPTYERTAAKHENDGAPYSPNNPPPIDAENPPDDWEECGSCGGYHPPDFYGDCRDDFNRWPSPYTTGEKPIEGAHAPDLSLHYLNKQFMGGAACVQQKKAWDNAGIKPQARSVKQVKACEGCAYFRKDASGKACNLYHLPVVANTQELSQIVNKLTPGVPEKRKHAALVSIANGDDRRAQSAAVASQTNLVKTADARVRNQSKRASYDFGDEREGSRKFSSEHVAKLHEKGLPLGRIYKWASEKFGDVDTSFAFRGFVNSLRKNAKGRIAIAGEDLKFLNRIGIRSEAYVAAAKCASCPAHFASPHRVVEEDRGAQRVDQKFASTTVDAVRSRHADTQGVGATVTARKVRTLHQAGHSVERIYKGASSKFGSVEARKAVAGYLDDLRRNPGKVAVSREDRAFLEGKLGFKPEQVRFLDPNRRPVTQVVASVPDDQHLLSYPGMGKQAGEKKAADGHAILSEYDLAEPHPMEDIDGIGPQGEVEIGGTFKVEL